MNHNDPEWCHQMAGVYKHYAKFLYGHKATYRFMRKSARLRRRALALETAKAWLAHVKAVASEDRFMKEFGEEYGL